MLHGCVRLIECYIRKQEQHSMQQIAIETRPQMRAATDAFCAMRAKSLRIAARLSPEDCQVQSMLDASPIKWHLAHTASTRRLGGHHYRPRTGNLSQLFPTRQTLAIHRHSSRVLNLWHLLM